MLWPDTSKFPQIDHEPDIFHPVRQEISSGADPLKRHNLFQSPLSIKFYKALEVLMHTNVASTLL